MFPPTSPPDPRMMLVQMMAQQGSGPAELSPAMVRQYSVGSIHQMMQQLAAQVVRQKQPLGRARVSRPAPPHPAHSPVDGGYNWGQRGFVHPQMWGTPQPNIPV